jgi:ribonuclease P protein component
LQRLRSKTQFQAAMAGPPVAKTPHFALHRVSLDARSGDVCLFPVQDTWLGVLIPKRWARRAVTRNTIRRQIYEVARLRASTLPEAGLVVRLRSEFSRKQFVSATSTALKQAVRQELVTLLGRLAPRPTVPNVPVPETDRAV